MITVAVTGNAASGKSLVCDIFERLGAYVISLDELAREVVKPHTEVFKKIVEHFGEEILTPEGDLNRRRLRQIITTDPEARKTLERFTHPAIFDLMDKEIASIRTARGDRIIVIEVPLLIERGLQDRFDVVILVDVESEIQKRRLSIRDNVSDSEAQALLAIQMPTEKKRKYADFIIKNNGSMKELEIVSKEIYKKIAERS
nr:dephospho-CoA kinase [Desulfobacterales bacterium]